MRDKDQAAIEKTLAALNEARPPEGMEARIQQRLRYHAAATPATAPDWWLPGRTWWMGVLTGAVVATVVCVAAWMGLRGPAEHGRAITASAGTSPAKVVVVSRPAEPQRGMPCAAPAVRREARRADAVLARAAMKPAMPVPAVAHDLTPQERELVRLAQVTDPKELAAMTSEAKARADAQQAAAFEKFFTPPPPPPHDEGANE
jgi:hypothetical protein